MITTALHKKDLKILFNQLKSSAKKRRIKFTISLSDLYELSFPITCPILDIPLVWNRGKAEDNSYSIDRIDSTKGYEPGNLVVISNRANKLKSNATIAEIQKLAEYYTNV